MSKKSRKNKQTVAPVEAAPESVEIVAEHSTDSIPVIESVPVESVEVIASPTDYGNPSESPEIAFNVPVNVSAIALHDAIRNNFDIIMRECDAVTVGKYRREANRYSDAFCNAIESQLRLTAKDFDFMLRVPSTQKRIAIYAMQKVTKLLSALISKHNASYCDKFTRAVLTNLRDMSNMSNYAQRASMSRDLVVANEDDYRTRCYAAISTADTQRSSTAIALHCLQLAVYDKSAKTVSLSDEVKLSADMRKLLNKLAKSAALADSDESDEVIE